MSVATADGPLVLVIYMNSFRMVTAMCAVARTPFIAGEWISERTCSEPSPANIYAVTAKFLPAFPLDDNGN
jgi:hypothetical protein